MTDWLDWNLRWSTDGDALVPQFSIGLYQS